MQQLRSPTGASVSCLTYGSGPPLVLVHGGFSDHETNWAFVRPLLEPHFTVYAVARRGRGNTKTPAGHTLADEGRDVAALIEAIDEPVFLLGHSYGGQVVLSSVLLVPEHVRKLVLYEPPWPSALSAELVATLEALARDERWDEVAVTFFRDGLSVPSDELAALRASDLWPPIVGDAQATLGDLRALVSHDFDPARYRTFRSPVLLQIGEHGPREPYVTAALAAELPDARVEILAGQAHEGMTTAPELYARSVRRFLLG
jgi:pimeloyl-ACP methyl ester carboxylesterase